VYLAGLDDANLKRAIKSSYQPSTLLPWNYCSQIFIRATMLPEEDNQATTTPLHTTPPETKRYFEPPPDQPANSLSREAVPTLKDAAGTITWEDFKKVHLQPCFREANLYGMGAGFAVGGVRFIFGGKYHARTVSKIVRRQSAYYWDVGGVPKSCNWAVGGFVLTSIACYERCQYRRRKEKAGMRKAAEIIEAKRVEREQTIAEKRAQREKAGTAGTTEAVAASQKPWYKFW
jgi:cytochrome c oxidase assembly protein subunit 20